LITLDNLHTKHRVVHTDLKPENILIADINSIFVLNKFDLLPI